MKTSPRQTPTPQYRSRKPVTRGLIRSLSVRIVGRTRRGLSELLSMEEAVADKKVKQAQCARLPSL
jgi:hypothetical protein